MRNATVTLAAELDEIITYAKGKQFPASLRARLRGLRRGIMAIGTETPPANENAVQRVLARLRGYLK